MQAFALLACVVALAMLPASAAGATEAVTLPLERRHALALAGLHGAPSIGHHRDTRAGTGMRPRTTTADRSRCDSSPDDDDAWLYRSLGGALLLMMLAGAVTLHITRINRRLRASLAELREGRDRLLALSTAIEQSPTSVMITDPSTRIEYVNPQFCAITGYRAEEAIGKTTDMMKSGRTDPAVYRDMWERLNRGEPWNGEIVNRRKSGECYWEDLHIAPVKNAAGETVHFVALKLDIEARKQAEAQLAASEAKFRAFVENANDIIYSHDRDGVITYVSPNWTEILGHASDEIVGRNLLDLLHPDDAPAGREFIERMLATGTKQGGLEYRMRHRNGTWHWYTANGAPLFDADGGISALLGIARDVSERKEAETRIRHMALYDALTDLPNRTLLFDRLAQAMRNARRDQKRLALLYVDLDRFKPINDTWGHAVGDSVLQAVAQRMLACVRESDTVARIGGDEFVVLLREVEGADDAAQVGEKIRRALGSPIVVGDGTFAVSSSVGIALFPDHGGDEHELALNADHAMYRAKAGGRDSVEMYRAETGEQAPPDPEDRTG